MCSIAPPMRRPRGPRKLRPALETKPSVARRPRPPGLATATTAVPIAGASPGSQCDRLDLAGVDGHDREVEVAVGAGHLTRLLPPVGEGHGDLVVANRVRAREHLAGGDHHARAAPPAAPEPHGRAADLLGKAPDGGPESPR